MGSFRQEMKGQAFDVEANDGLIKIKLGPYSDPDIELQLTRTQASTLVHELLVAIADLDEEGN